MTPFEVISCLILLPLGLALLWFLGKVIFTAISNAMSGGAGRSNYQSSQKRPSKKYSKGIAAIDKLIEEKEYKKAIKSLKKSLQLEKEPNESSLAIIKELHENILSRFLLIAEALGARIPNIGQLENLFLDHAELNIEIVKNKLSYQKLKVRREKVGKEIPSWSKEDFKKKKKELGKNKAENIKLIKKELESLYKILKNPPPKEEESPVTYH